MASAATVGDDGASGVAATVTATEATVLTGDSLLQLEAALQAELDGVGVALLADTSGVLLLCTVCHRLLRLRAALFLFLFSHTHAHTAFMPSLIPHNHFAAATTTATATAAFEAHARLMSSGASPVFKQRRLVTLAAQLVRSKYAHMRTLRAPQAPLSPAANTHPTHTHQVREHQ